MRILVALGLVAGLGLGLGGCSLFGPDEELSGPGTEAPAPDLPPAPVQDVRRLEIGQTRDGIALAAFGTAPGLGYGLPRLVPRREGTPGADGMLDYDFLLTPPDPALGLPQGTVRARAARADVQIPLDNLRGVRGIRVHASSGGMQMIF